MQHAHALKKLNFHPHPQVHPQSGTQTFDPKSHLICFIFIVPLSACEISVINIASFDLLTPSPGLVGWGDGGWGTGGLWAKNLLPYCCISDSL